MLHTAGYLRLGSRAVRADLAERLAGALSQIRRGSETSAFVVPPELSAQVGCPQAEFAGVLRALGLKPAEKDKETGAVKLWRFHAQRRPVRHADNAGAGAVQGETAPAEAAPVVAEKAESRKEGERKRGRRRGRGKRGPEREAPAAGVKPQTAAKPSRDKPRPPPRPPPSGPFAVLAEMLIMQQPQRAEPQQQRRRRRRPKRTAATGAAAPKAAS